MKKKKKAAAPRPPTKHVIVRLKGLNESDLELPLEVTHIEPVDQNDDQSRKLIIHTTDGTVIVLVQNESFDALLRKFTVEPEFEVKVGGPIRLINIVLKASGWPFPRPELIFAVSIEAPGQAGTQLSPSVPQAFLFNAITFVRSANAKEAIHEIRARHYQSIHSHQNVVIIKEVDSPSAVVLDSDSSASKLTFDLKAGTVSVIEMNEVVLGFLWDDLIVGSACVAGLKRMPGEISEKLAALGLNEGHGSGSFIVHGVAGNMLEVAEALGWNMNPPLREILP